VTGLANRSAEEIKAMFLDGLRPGGQALIPVMPYWSFHNMTAQDADAIVAFLRTVPGVDHTVPASQAPWVRPDDPRPPLDPADIPSPDPEADNYQSALRGRYLAAMAGLCLECHTQETDCGVPPCPLDMAHAFEGGRMFPGIPMPPFDTVMTVSPNITPHNPTGIGAYTAPQLEAAIRDGQQLDGTVICPPMPAGPMAPFSGLTDDDVADIISYIQGNEPVETEETPACDLQSK
jgi:mono/diheme cytochrome c family protein